jgi:hypothetical protein
LFRCADGDLIAADDGFETIFDGATGALRTVRNRVSGQALVDVGAGDGAALVPWRLTLQGALWHVPEHVTSRFTVPSVEPAGFSFSIAADGESAVLSWTTTDPGIGVEVEARGATGGGLELWPRVTVAEGTVAPLKLMYPVLVPQPLSADEAGDVLLFPAQSGYLVRRPLAGPPLSTFYPDGYDGCSLQMMAYYAEGVGGFYLACHDPHSTVKALRFSASEAGFEHDAWDLRSGAAMDLDYPVVLAPLTAGHWFEAVERYRAWVLPNAPWAHGGVPNVARENADDRRWLFEEVGLSIWGTPSSLDWSPWYRFYAEVAGTPLHISAGWDWPASHPHSVGRDGWFPAQLHPANVEAWEGHHVTPYMNDLFISDRVERFAEDWEPNLLYPHTAFNWGPFSEARPGFVDGRAPGSDPAVTTNHDMFTCPATEAQRELHAWRDATLVADHGMAGVCYDISSGNPRVGSRCLRTDHGHTPGRGREIIQAYEAVNLRSKELTRSETGRYLVQGVEVIIENVVSSMDFYVARACAGPVGALEAWSFGAIEPPGGSRELVPLFQAVYHDVGPVHEDGWLTLSEEEGDLFYWIAARIVLQWGGLLALHYANNRPERVPGHDGPAALIDWDGARVEFDDDLPDADPGKIAFIRQLAAARTDFAKAYLAYGRMLRPLEVAAETVELAYDQRYEALPGVANAGTWPVPEVVHGAWADQEGSVGIVLTNVRGDAAVDVHLVADAADWGIDLAGRTVRRRDAGDEASVELAPVPASGLLDVIVSLPPRSVTLVELPV